MDVRRVLALALVGVVVGAAAWFWWPSEEDRVRQRVEAMAAAASSPANEDDLSRLARARRFLGWMRQDVRVDFEQSEWPPLVGRDAVAALVARPWPQTAAGVTVELQDLRISLSADGTTADVRGKARIASREPSQDPVTLDGRMFAVTLNRVDGEWLVAGARIMRSDDAVR
jgi:hypothetical protein